MDPHQRLETLYKRLHAYLLGGVDMHDVIETADYLRGQHVRAAGHDAGMPWRARRTLETGIFVTYARPFTEARGGGLPKLKRARGLPEELLKAHRDILERRHEVYAHTSETELRRILEIADPGDRVEWVRNQGELREHWSPPTRATLEDVMALAAANLASIVDEIEKTRAAILELEKDLALT